MNPTEINTQHVTIYNINTIKDILLENTVAIYPINDISKEIRNTALNETNFYQNVNHMFKEPIPEPTLYEKLHPAELKKHKVPMASQGFINEYFTNIHMLLNKNSNIKTLFDNIYNMKHKLAPNRLRICRKFKHISNSLHIEGEDIFQKEDEHVKLLRGKNFGCIAAITGIRRFVFWDMKGANILPLYEYWKNKGGKNFTKIDLTWMNNTYPNRRKMITVDCSEHMHLIFFDHCIPHEIALSPSLSAFISPIEHFNNTKITKICSYHPPEYLGLTKHESNLLGSCYNLPGFEWPSGKTAHLIHARAYTFYINRLKDRYLKIKQNGAKTIQMQLPITGTINQRSSYYQQALTNKGIKLPSIAFDSNTPNFIVDLLTLDTNVLKLYGFIDDTDNTNNTDNTDNIHTALIKA